MGGGVHRNVQEVLFVDRIDDPGQGPDLGITQPSRGERGIDLRQLAERPGHPHLLAGGVGSDAAVVAEPGGGGEKALALGRSRGIELGDETEQFAGGGIDAGAEVDDAVAEIFFVNGVVNGVGIGVGNGVGNRVADGG
jgi:hypothetical protein